jgi:hypothetical protein
MKRHIIMLVAAVALSPIVSGTRSNASPAQHGAAVEPQAQDKPMIAMRQKMIANMHASDAELDSLVAAMKAAKGEARIAVIAELLTRLVQRQTTMREAMQESMKTMKAQCPMTKDAGHQHEP